MPIKSVLSKARVPVKIWSDIEKVESGALTQLSNTANLPFVFKHVAVMPDVHIGKGATVGSVVATKGAIVPACVGVDLGCGCIAIQTTLNTDTVQENISDIRKEIERVIPVGFNGNKHVSSQAEHWDGWKDWNKLTAKVQDTLGDAKAKLGSLGGGNHFIEICLDEDQNIWVMLHSGSRNIGNRIAQYHINEAKGMMKKMFINLVDKDLSYLVEGTKEFKDYIFDLTWAQDYALMNRNLMMQKIIVSLSKLIEGEFSINQKVNCHHNYVSRENHYGENVLVTRKGAVRAREGDMGIIPGSMGVKSYIVEGLGNKESFCSCSHGAGRKMSRTAAKQKFNIKDLEEQTEGVNCRKDKGV